MFQALASWLYTFGFIGMWIIAALLFVAVAYLLILIPASLIFGKWYEKMGITPDGWAISLSFIIGALVAWNVMTLPAYCPEESIYTGKKYAFMRHPAHYAANGCMPAFFENKWLVFKVPFMN